MLPAHHSVIQPYKLELRFLTRRPHPHTIWVLSSHFPPAFLHSLVFLLFLLLFFYHSLCCLFKLHLIQSMKGEENHRRQQIKNLEIEEAWEKRQEKRQQNLCVKKLQCLETLVMYCPPASLNFWICCILKYMWSVNLVIHSFTNPKPCKTCLSIVNFLGW